MKFGVKSGVGGGQLNLAGYITLMFSKLGISADDTFCENKKKKKKKKKI